MNAMFTGVKISFTAGTLAVQSNFVKGNIHWIIGALVLIAFAFKRFYATEKAKP